MLIIKILQHLAFLFILMTKYTKSDMDNFIILCRFQLQVHGVPRYGCMTYSTIGSLVGRSGNYCRVVCK